MSNLPIIMGLRGQSSGEPRVQLAIYVADTRKDGQPLLRDEFETWVGLIGRALCEMAGGCTRFAAQGLYVRREDGQLMRETTAVLKASAERRKVIEGVPRLRQVLVQYGRECEQECVGFEVDGEFYTLTP